MTNFYDKPYLYYLDYLLLIIGFVIIGMGVLIYLFSKQSNNAVRNNFKLYISFLFVSGFAVWIELITDTFPESHLFHLADSILHIISYVILLELARKMNLFRKKMLVLFLAFILLTDILVYLYQDSSFIEMIHLVKHFIEWSIILIVTWIIYLKIISNSIQDPIEMQLKKIKVRLIKALGIIFIFTIVLGYFALVKIGELSFNSDREDMLHIVKYSALGIDGDLHQQLQKRTYDVEDQLYRSILKKLEEIKNQSPEISEVYTMYLQEENLLFGVDVNIEPGDEGNLLGDIYFGTPMMFSVINDGKALAEKQIDTDQWGNWLSAYAPIKNQAGQTVALLGIDMQADRVFAHIKNFRFIGLIFLLLTYLLIIVLAHLYYINKKEKVWRNYHSKILSTIGDIVGVFDKDNKLIYVNNAGYKLFGSTKNDKPSSVCLKDLLIEEDYQILKENLKDLKKDSIKYSELTIKNAFGDLIPIYASLSYLENIQDEPLFVFTAMNITEQKKREEDIKNNFQNFLSLIATVIDAKDSYTALHSANVSSFAGIIARELGLNEHKIKEIETAAIVHDIGKVGIPDSILKKRDKLSEKEWEEMKKHPEYGKKILEKAGKSFESLIPYVYYHHERIDGTGYPTGLKNLPLHLAIIPVADAFEAMISDRSYRRALPLEKAKEELLKSSGTQFHPEVVKVFLHVLKDIFDNKDISNIV